MEWYEDKIDGDVTRAIRRDMRLYRREKGKRGHKFSFNNLAAIQCMDNEPVIHVIVTHHNDPAWQHYWRHPEKGWLLQLSHDTSDAARTAAESFDPSAASNSTAKRDEHGRFIGAPTTVDDDSTYVVAGWADRPNAMKVKASSEWTAQQLAGIFDRLGCVTQTTIGKTR